MITHSYPVFTVILAGWLATGTPATGTPAPKAKALPDNLRTLADSTAAAHGLPAGLFSALIAQESGWNIRAMSPVGAIGLAQIMPGTGAAHCNLSPADLLNPALNLACGASYLSAQRARFGDDRLALAAYNSGPGRVARLGRVPRIPETQAYVRNICEKSGLCGGVQ